MSKKQKKIVIILSVLCAAFILFDVVLYFSLNSRQLNNGSSENNDGTGLSIVSYTENGEWMEVETSYGKFHYPFAFSDIIKIEAVNKGVSAQLRFSAKIEDKIIDAYTIYFNEPKGVPCGILKMSEEIPVTVEFENAPKKLDDDWLITFNAVQETFNDVLISMSENNDFEISD
ncbi:MAG: hypothetical protein IJ262_08755 [Clostridia bacterium]|nr:hypothetical protein [Clostridia bacterium]